MTIQIHAVSTGRKKGEEGGRFTDSSQKACVLLSLITHWPEFGHVTMPNYRDVGKCNLNVGGYELIEKSPMTKEEGESESQG